MKKLLKLLTIMTFSAPISLSVVACSNQPNWNGIPIPPPEVPIDVTGFAGVDFQSMNIKDYDTVKSLFSTIKDKLATSPWKAQSATTWSGKKDGAVISNLDPDELTRNGTYTFEIKSNIDFAGDAKFIITITNSRDISDNLSVTNLGIIDDIQPKTILIACVFKNMNLVSKINEIAAEYIDHMIDITPHEDPKVGDVVSGSATLSSPETNTDKSSPYFTGTVKVNFSVKTKEPPENRTNVKTAITQPNLGTIPDNRMYTILMYVIIKNFVTKLDSLAEIINNLDITEIDKNSATLSGTPGSKYYKDSIKLTFETENK